LVELAEGIRRVDTFVAMTGNHHEAVAGNGRQRGGMCVEVDRGQQHRVRTTRIAAGRSLVGTLVDAHEQNRQVTGWRARLDCQLRLRFACLGEDL
jgi:hypothetical protein